MSESLIDAINRLDKKWEDAVKKIVAEAIRLAAIKDARIAELERQVAELKSTK